MSDWPKCIAYGCVSDSASGSHYCPKHESAVTSIIQQVRAEAAANKAVPTSEGVRDTGAVRQFSTGATRDTGSNKPQLSLYISPLVLKRYGQFMLKHQRQSDGTIRAGDNWQKGIPGSVYLDSEIRHVLDFWLWQRGFQEEMVEPGNIEDALCAIIFNASGQLHEILKGKLRNLEQEVG
ncbi:MAG: hypothetical protein MN733_14225 [Nitrososphaera sp.]|nr:hypothetical protein [Nitrososphaera sp.]